MLQEVETWGASHADGIDRHDNLEHIQPSAEDPRFTPLDTYRAYVEKKKPGDEKVHKVEPMH